MCGGNPGTLVGTATSPKRSVRFAFACECAKSGYGLTGWWGLMRERQANGEKRTFTHASKRGVAVITTDGY